MNSDNGINAGTMFYFDYGGNSRAYGQVLIGGVVFYAVVFKKEFDIKCPTCIPLIASWTTDAELFHKRWISIGVYQLLCPVPELEYKLYINGICYIERIVDGYRRLANEQEEKILPYKKSVSPIRFVKIVNAYYGHGEWKTHFDELLVKS